MSLALSLFSSRQYLSMKERERERERERVRKTEWAKRGEDNKIASI